MGRSKEAWDVLQQYPSGSNFANDPNRLGPHVSLIVCGLLLTGNGEGLTWEARRDDIHASTPGSPVEGLHIVPDWEVLKESISLSLLEGFDAVGLALNGADGSPSKESGAKEASASPGK
tara:strand:+ start:2622 stop:2978 length:357 start_codon:yes stop_codon:yes gene_type:complete